MYVYSGQYMYTVDNVCIQWTMYVYSRQCMYTMYVYSRQCMYTVDNI